MAHGHAQGSYSAIVVQKEALLLISETARSICIEVEQTGAESITTLGGAANATLNDAIAKVANLNISGNAQLNRAEYHGVVRAELATTLASAQRCRQAVFETLVTKMLPPMAAQTGLPTQQSIRLRPRTTQQPSIDCNKAQESVEQLLCADADLAEWDGRLGAAYRQWMQRLSTENQITLRQQQREWIKQRDAACKLPARGARMDDIVATKPCVLQMTRQRLAQLGG
jgi:uncharacterized protein YecT (DUF1311 family)